MYQAEPSAIEVMAPEKFAEILEMPKGSRPMIDYLEYYSISKDDFERSSKDLLEGSFPRERTDFRSE